MTDQCLSISKEKFNLENEMTSSRSMDEKTNSISIHDILGSPNNPDSWELITTTAGPSGKLPYTSDFLINDASGFHFGMSQNAGMGWNPSELGKGKLHK